MRLENLEISIGGIAEQDNRQCQFCKNPETVTVDPGFQNAQKRRAENQTRQHEHQWSIEQT